MGGRGGARRRRGVHARPVRDAAGLRRGGRVLRGRSVRSGWFFGDQQAARPGYVRKATWASRGRPGVLREEVSHVQGVPREVRRGRRRPQVGLRRRGQHRLPHRPAARRLPAPAEERFGEASAERGAEVGLKAKLLSLSLFALLETMRDGKDKLDAVVAARAELDAVAGSGAAEPIDPMLDATVNVSDSASTLEGSTNGVVAALTEAAELFVGVGWTGRLSDELAQAADCAAGQLAYAQSAASAYADYAKVVGDFEDALVPRLDPDGFLQVSAAREWANEEIAGGGPGIGEWLAAIGDAADGAGGSLGAVGGMLRGFRRGG